MRELELAADALDRSGYDASSKRARNEAYAARAALAAAPVGEPSDEDLQVLARKLVKIKMDSYGCVYDVLPFARAVLFRWANPAAPPAPEVVGEVVGEVVRRLKNKARMEGLVGRPLAARMFTEAAALLQRQAAPDYRALLADVLRTHPLPRGHYDPEARVALEAAHAALLVPEATPAAPPAPEPGEVVELVAALNDAVDGAMSMGWETAGFAILRAVTLLQQQAAPALVVVPVAERLPEPGDCDVEGRCWWFTPPACGPHKIRPCWTFDSEIMEGDTHWLPAHAIPLPQAGEVQP
jgi:hypothetical protein